jgi:hypothetical protein
MERMVRFISKRLGPFEDFLDELPKLVKVTNGASATRGRRRSQAHRKVSLRPYATPSCEPYLQALASYWGYGDLRVRPIGWNRIETVPKSWKTDRTIACEPEGNTFLQLAGDSYIKRKLRGIGVNLSDQTRNQSWAREGSIGGHLATIDLSMASDTLSYNLVAWLLPYPWLKFFSDVRSPLGKLKDGTKIPYAKFSSMGNGATFTIETLIFAAACDAVGASEYTVYGDDIILSSDRSHDLLQLLRFMGFMPNWDKSYL